MGALGYALAGMGEGLGRGVATIGGQMAQENMREEQMRWQMERDRANQDNMLQRQRDLLELKSELGALKSGTGKGGGGSAPIDPQSDQARALMVATSGGRLTDAEARDAQAMWRGETPTVTRTKDLAGPPDEAGNGPGSAEITQNKYDAQGSRGLLERATAALDRAMMGSNMGDSDKYAKALTETDKRGYANDYVRTGNAQSARGALLMEGKDLASNAGTDVVTGQAKAGSVAQSQITENNAQASSARAAAGKYSEEAKSVRQKRDGTSVESIKEDLQLIEGQRKKLASDLADIRAQEAIAAKSMDDASTARLREQRKMLEQQSQALDQQFGALTTRLTERRQTKDGKTAPSTSSAPPANRPPLASFRK